MLTLRGWSTTDPHGVDGIGDGPAEKSRAGRSPDEFVPPLLTAMANLDPDPEEVSRRLVYERARSLLSAHLGARSPAPAGDEIEQARSALEQAIGEVEAVVSGPDWPAVKGRYRRPPPAPVAAGQRADIASPDVPIDLSDIPPALLPEAPASRGARGLTAISIAVAAALVLGLLYLRGTSDELAKAPGAAAPAVDDDRSTQSRIDRALADLPPAVEAEPTTVEAHLNRGEAWARKAAVDRAVADEPAAATDLDRAIQEFTEVIRLKPDLGAAYHGRGESWARKGDQARAISDLNEAIRRNPNDALAYLVRAAVFVAKGENDLAIVDLTRAIGLATIDAVRLPGSKLAQAYDTRAGLYGRKGLDDREADDLGRMIELCVRDPHALDDIMHDGRPVAAPAFLASAYVRRAKVHLRQRRNADAIADFRKALAVDPDLQEPKDALAQLRALR